MARRIVAVCAVLCALVVGSAPARAGMQIVGENGVAPGLRTFQVRLPKPTTVYVAELAPETGLRPRVATAPIGGDRRAPTSFLCGRCLVAVNGGFFSTGTGLPVAGQSPEVLAMLLDPARRATAHTVQWLMKDGKVWPFGTDSFSLARHPRTFLFGDTSGTIWFAAADGRQPGYSVGLSLPEVVSVGKRLGASWIVNLDGGCSTTFVVRGVVKNRPCQDATSVSGERPVANAFVVLPAPAR